MRKKFQKLVTLVLILALTAAGTPFLRAEAAGKTLTVTKQPSDATVYAGDTVKLSVTVTGGSQLTYQWYKNTIDSTSSGFKITGATSYTYSPSTSNTGTMYYYCRIYSGGVTIAAVLTETAAVVVKALPQITTQPVGSTVYTGQTASLSVQATGSGTLTYQWYSSSSKSGTNAVQIQNAVNPSYTVPTTEAGTTYYFCVVTNTDSAVTTTQARSVSSTAAKVIVNALSTTTPVITSQPTAATVYTGASAQVSVAAAASGTLSYQWYSNTINSTENAAAVSGATSSSYSFPTSATGTTYYYCVVTNTVTGTSAGTYQTTSSIVPCAVKAATAVTTQPEGKTADLGDTVTLTVAATGSGTLTYQWYKTASDSTSGGSKITGATSASYSLPTTSTGTAYYYCVVTNTDSAITSTVKTSTATSSAAKVSILVDAVTAPAITAQPAAATVYAGTLKNISVTATGTGALSYQWYSNTTADTASGTAISGATGSSYAVSTGTEGTVYYYCVVKNTADTASGQQSMTVTSSAAPITVLPLPAITQQPQDASLCSGSAVSLSVGATGSSALTYQWYVNTANKVGGSKISGATGASYTVQASNVGTSYYYCIVTNTDGRITETTNTASVTSKLAAVTVVSADADAPIITKQPAGATVVTGTAVTLSVTAAGTGTLSYQWYSNGMQSTVSASPIQGAVNATYTPSTAATGKTYYYCQVTNTDSTKTKTPSKSVLTGFALINVNPVEPTIVKQPTSSTVYVGATQYLTVTASGLGALTYQWYSSEAEDNTGGTPIAGAVTPKYTVPSNQPGTFYYYCVVTNTVTSASGNLTGATASAPVHVDVVTYPAITSQPLSVTVNGGDTVTLSVEVSGSGIISYQWCLSSSPTATGTAIKNANAPEYSYKAAVSNTTKTVYYYCVVTVSDKTVTQNPKVTLKSTSAAVTIKAINAAPPAITKNPISQNVKLGASATLTVTATASGTLTYQWYSNTKNSSSGATPIAGATSAALPIPSDKVGTMYYYCVVTNTDTALSGTQTASVTSPIARIIVKAG